MIGPAGVGKSRLVRELEHYAEGLPEFVYWRRGRCLAYGNASYSALADAIKAQCEILEDDATDVAVKKTDDAVRELFGDTEIAPQVRALVGAGEAGSFAREDLFEAWRRFLERMAARYPLTVILEDIHWADDGLLDFIEHTADWAQGPILVVALARPELFDAGRTGAAASGTRPRSTSTRCPRVRARRCSATCCRATSTRASSARSPNGARATRSTWRRSSAS